MENNNSTNELEMMREQLALLKDKLDKQEIVNDHLISESMKNKMSWIRKYVAFEMGLVPFIIIMWAVFAYFSGVSWWTYVVLIIGCVIDVFFDYRINLHAMKDSDYDKCNLIETAQKLLNMKHQRFLQMVISMPLLIIWFFWFFLDIYIKTHSTPVNDIHYGILCGGLVGGVVGCILGLGIACYLYNKMQRTNDDVIRQINDIVKE